MARCIAFDKQTARAISRDLHMLAICDPEGDPVQSALQSPAPTSLLLLPGESPRRVLVATFRRHGQAAAVPQPQTADLTVEATGFLGLSDHMVYEEEAEPPKKWWQKLLY